jgi:hypothetical protein
MFALSGDARDNDDVDEDTARLRRAGSEARSAHLAAGIEPRVAPRSVHRAASPEGL